MLKKMGKIQDLSIHDLVTILPKMQVSEIDSIIRDNYHYLSQRHSCKFLLYVFNFKVIQ